MYMLPKLGAALIKCDFLNGPKIGSEFSNMLSYLTIRYPECFVGKIDHDLIVGCLKD
jgi:hypothetical protein